MRSLFIAFLLFVASLASAQDDSLVIGSIEINPDAHTALVPVYLCQGQPYCFVHFRFGWDSSDGKIVPAGITPGTATGWQFGIDKIETAAKEISIIGMNPGSDQKGRLYILNLVFSLDDPQSQTIDLTSCHQERLGYCDGEGGIEPIFAAGKIRIVSSVPGDANGSGVVTGEDIVYLVKYLRSHGPSSIGPSPADADGNCLVDKRDVTYLIKYWAHNGPAPIFGDCH